MGFQMSEYEFQTFLFVLNFGLGTSTSSQGKVKSSASLWHTPGVYNKLTLIFINLLLKVSSDTFNVSQSSDRGNKSDTKKMIYALDLV